MPKRELQTYVVSGRGRISGGSIVTICPLVGDIVVSDCTLYHVHKIQGNYVFLGPPISTRQVHKTGESVRYRGTFHVTTHGDQKVTVINGQWYFVQMDKNNMVLREITSTDSIS